MPFWDLVRDIFDQGFNRTKAAHIMGMQGRAFNSLLQQYPDENPWGSSNIVANYVRDTGETFKDALLRMQREGYSLSAAGRAIGFRGGGGCGIVHAMKVRGINIKFTYMRPKKPKKADRGPSITKGWPTWAKIYEIGQTNGFK